MKSNTPLHDLGFAEKKKKPRRRPRRKILSGPPTGTTMDRIHNKFINMNKNLPADTPPDTGIGRSGHDDAIEKGDSGFMSYMGEKWREGYPR